jgi:hypothetical protein
MAEEKILEGEVIEETKKKVESEEPKEAPKEEPKKEETEKKDFFLIRGAKAVGRGIVKTGKVVGGFIEKHPYISSGISAGLGWAAKMGYDYLTESRSEAAPVEDHEEPAMLPEPEEPDCDDYNEEPEMEPEAEPTIVSEE